MKKFKTYNEVKDFLVKFGEAMSFLNDTRFISYDINIDADGMEGNFLCAEEHNEEWNDQIYICKNGTCHDPEWRDDKTHLLKISYDGSEYTLTIEEYKD